ncbi:hypothetical protein H4R35_007436 [Dimargaris xerosporica]|nr:hypothetical protein H4R35_007436 [Dimargaris xerosporica]
MTQSAWAAPRLVRRTNDGKGSSVQGLDNRVNGQTGQTLDATSLTSVQPLPAAQIPKLFVQQYLQGLERYDRQIAENDPAATIINKDSGSTNTLSKSQLAAKLCWAHDLSKEEKVTAMIIFINNHLLKDEHRVNGNIRLLLEVMFTTTGKAQQRIKELESIDPAAAKYLNDFPSNGMFEIRMAKYIYHVLSKPPRAKL